MTDVNDLPDGTVTFFTDVEGATRLLKQALAPRELDDFEGPVVLHELLADADTAPALRLVAPPG